MSNIEGIRFVETPEQRRQREEAVRRPRPFRIGEIDFIDWDRRRREEQVAIDDLRRKIGSGL